MSIPDRTVEMRIYAADGVSQHHLSGSEVFVDQGIGPLLKGAIAQGGYTIEEESTRAATCAIGAVNEGLPLNALPAEWVPLNQQVLGLVRPPLPDYKVKRIADILDFAGIRTCGDVMDGGLLGLSRTGLHIGELEVVTGLVKAITGRPIPIGNESTKK